MQRRQRRGGAARSLRIPGDLRCSGAAACGGRGPSPTGCLSAGFCTVRFPRAAGYGEERPDVAPSVSPDRVPAVRINRTSQNQRCIGVRSARASREADAEACAARGALGGAGGRRGDAGGRRGDAREPASPRSNHELAAERGAPSAAGAADRAGPRCAVGSSAPGDVGVRRDHRPLVAPPHGAGHDGASLAAASDLAV